MKPAIIALLSTIIATVTASASQALLVQTTIIVHDDKGRPEVLSAPSITVESGRRAVVQIGKLEYAVTPILLDDGTVDISAILTERDGEKSDKLAAPRIKTKLGEAAQIQIGQYTFATKTSLAK
jgi:hypothetical protein